MDNTLYKPLDPSQSEIRLLEIVSLKPDQPVECRLRTVSLDDKPLYATLSYVWGDATDTKDVIVNGQIRAVTKNLESALRHIRTSWDFGFSSEGQFFLWADAICINQADLDERASQVRMMGSIYRECRVVFVWLALDTEDTKDAFELGRTYTYREIVDMSEPYESRARQCLRYLNSLTYLPWFERMWTFQEVLLPYTAHIVCGSYSLPLSGLEDCCKVLEKMGGRPASQEAWLIFRTRWRSSMRPRTTRSCFHPDTFERFLLLRRRAKASDPRDRIYSLLGLFSPEVTEALQPDYSITIKDLFVRATKQIIRVTREPKVLYAIEKHGNQQRPDEEILPSWVPDWRSIPEACLDYPFHWDNHRWNYQATGTTNFRYDFGTNNLNELHVYGIRIGTVDQAGPFDDAHAVRQFRLPETYTHTNQPIRAALRQAQIFDRNEVEQHSGTPGQVFLELRDDRDFSHPKKTCTACPIAHDMPLISMDGNEPLYGPEREWTREISKQAINMVHDRAFFTTDSGHLGFGPKHTAPGDHVFLLLGTDVPFVLRSVGEKFEVLGACYVHGIMYGEGLHSRAGFDSRHYPGSVPEFYWGGFHWLHPIPWKPVAKGNDNDNSDRATSHEWKFLVSKENCEPLLVEAEKIVLI